MLFRSSSLRRVAFDWIRPSRNQRSNSLRVTGPYVAPSGVFRYQRSWPWSSVDSGGAYSAVDLAGTLVNAPHSGHRACLPRCSSATCRRREHPLQVSSIDTITFLVWVRRQVICSSGYLLVRVFARQGICSSGYLLVERKAAGDLVRSRWECTEPAQSCLAPVLGIPLLRLGVRQKLSGKVL